MNGFKLVKKFMMPCGLCAAVPAVKPASSESCPENCSNKLEGKKLIRPSELPIYSADESCTRQTPCPDNNCAPSYLEQGFGTIRKTVNSLVSEYSAVTSTISDTYDTGLEHSQLLLDYLQEESNVLPRLGAVGIGGLTGLIFGLRGGKFKKLVYSSTGALAVGAVCYPKQAQEGVELAKHYVNIGYNFIYGVKPGDENELHIEWPEFPKIKLPTSLSEFVSLATDSGAAAIAAVSSLASKASETLQESKKDATSPDDASKSKQS
ncbi:MICOS complex subunit MIC27 isoform X2 [Cephus cinctus]|uniref:MICOS complex subunit n=1 Tax=Cephus cinctus TaxID=211228 RepID=A0AAJ7FUG9_CEPCN|nr:MICOS complex subunit MIC27 isoform X2 [Cephus cinctus]